MLRDAKVARLYQESIVTTSCQAHPAVPLVDITKRYVRVRNQLDNGLIEFDFAIGWPELNVELLLPPTAFKAFCAANKVEFLPPADQPAA